MTIERIYPSGGWLISSIVGGYLVSRRYFGYSMGEALALYRAEIA